MFDIITIGSAVKDIFIDAGFLKKKDNYLLLECGSKNSIEKPFIQSGGGATNTAVAFSRLGLKIAMVSKLGDDESGHSIKKNLNEEKVNLNHLITDKNIGTAFSFIITKEGADRIVFTYRGASDNILLNEIKLNSLKTKWIYITALRGNSLKVLNPIIEYAKKNGIKIAVNPGSKELEMKSLYRYVDVLLLNKEEAEILSGKGDSINKIISKLLNLGPKIVVVTDGQNKVFVSDHKNIYSSKPYNIKIKSTLGAGDAFCSGFTSALIRNKNIEDAIKLGMLNASSVIQHEGAKAGLLHYRDVNSYENKLRQRLVIHKEKF